MWYVYKSDRMINSYTVSWWTWKLTKKLFFHLLDLPFQTVSSLLRLVVQNYRTDSDEEPNTSGRKNAFTSDQATKEAGLILEPTKMMCMVRHTLPFGREENLVHACPAENKTRTKSKCPELNVGLCASPCVKVCHTELCFWGPTDTKLEQWSTQM
jgi:hypothetical protein